MEKCIACMEPFSGRKKKVTCLQCKMNMCVDCCKSYMLGSKNDCQCMNCKQPWSRIFIKNNFTISFLRTSYKTHREFVLSEQADAMIAVYQDKIVKADKESKSRQIRYLTNDINDN